jgi:hypothetical protein
MHILCVADRHNENHSASSILPLVYADRFSEVVGMVSSAHEFQKVLYNPLHIFDSLLLATPAALAGPHYVP